ncbi:MAG: HEPN domain-containing protein [Patescibacteria group bacterium]
MTEADAVQAWKSSALEDIKLGEDLLMQGKNAHSLFFLHLAIEKIIKGVHQHLKHEPSLFIHDLYKLATKAGIEVPESEKLELDEISTFNVAARYDIFKLKLYQKATPEYAKIWMESGKSLFEKYLRLLP